MEIAIVLFAFVFMGILIKNIVEWADNNKQPRIPTEAKVISKRVSTTHHQNNGHMHVDYTYFITFEYATGDRSEIRLPHKEYRLIREGDTGTLTMQGTRFISFEPFL